MKKSRLEAFSDGVFAIVITLLILDIRLPHGNYTQLQDALIKLLPNIGIYVLSFVLIGMYWVFHHHTFQFVHEVDGVLLWLNIIFLLSISFMPFPTSLMGAYPFRTIPVVIYGSNLLFANMMGYLGIVYIHRNRQLASEIFTKKLFRSQQLVYLTVNGMYMICIFLAFFTPLVSGILFGAIALYLMIRSVFFMGIGKRNFSQN